MRIVGLEIENFLRVVAVNLRPDGRVVELTGKNAHGKTSILEAIWTALGGERAIPPDPIHHGADAAQIVVELGDDTGVKLKVSRKIRQKDGGGLSHSLHVENADGSRFQRPQDILNSLVGALSIDPLSFIRMKESERFELLKRLVPGVDFDAIAAAHKADYDKRTEINREAARLRSQAEAIAVPPGALKPAVDEQPLVDKLQAAGTHNAEIERERARRAQAEDAADRLEADAANKRRQADELRAEIAALEDAAAKGDKAAAAARAELKALPPLAEPIDAVMVRQQLDAARAHNAVVRDADRRQELLDAAQVKEAESEDLTDRMKARETAKQAAIAKAKLPIPGLTFGDGVALFDGVPLSQASGAQQLRISVLAAAAINPKLRFVRVKDGSLLDADSWAALVAMAEEMDLQVFVETVDSSRPAAVVIEEGRVKAPALQAAE